MTAMPISVGMILGLLKIESIGDDGIDAEIGETSAEADDDGLGRHVICRCRCGASRVFREAEIQSQTRCGDACTADAEFKEDDDGLKMVGAEKYRGRPGVFAIGDSLEDRHRRKLAENLSLFCYTQDGVFTVSTRYVVVYPDGARAIADSFVDAKIMFRDREAAADLGAAA